MNILHTEASPGWGGQEMRIVTEAIGMRDRGHKLFFAVQKDSEIGKVLRKENFWVYEINFHKIYWLFSFFHLITIIRKHKITIVNTHSSLDAWLAGMAARFLKKKIIRTRHLSTPIKKGLNSRLLYNSLVDYVVTTCSKIVPVITQQSGIALSCCQSIPTGMDFTIIDKKKKLVEAFRRKHHIAENDFLVGMVCFMRSWKGIDTFLQAAKQLESNIHVKCILIGGGHEETYRKKAENMQLKNFIFTGHLQDPFSAIMALDVFTLLSTASEGVSQASLQAAYLEKPLITTDVGGLGEVCLHNETGIIVPSYDFTAVAKAICTLQENPLLRREMGKKAKKLVIQNFSLKQMLDNLEQIYRKF